MNKDLDYYMALPYKVVLVPCDEGGYVAEIPDLKGCITQAETKEEIVGMIDDAKRLWLLAALEDGKEIPEPGKEDDYSGKFNVRVPKTLHRTLVELASSEGVSLNQFITYTLSRAIGLRPF
ncbi:type II toxin-antitoxin system HicB family antitoxin [Syntrophomonas wolfei]|jgi:antitoxin HicB|uniref:type II toxin-antitoxin system HicB family antitoxin n=1 Tax=Syntrophomonas wolfei TaxID=863 RepID=UPI0023F58637|nr:type II toxin-antitoxin system HicB family antitoxin [Syntrophomonas wolfei]